ncbi:MAG: hypothetical protein LBJ46_03380 [Planctomycetota bacterium]|jgi:hypothetical protein|nr:hypothetical protein [Planctomycetota bacterium]
MQDEAPEAMDAPRPTAESVRFNAAVPTDASSRSAISVRTRVFNRIAPALESLNDFDPATRQNALNELLKELANGIVKPAGESGWVNMHLHTFFSFCSEGYSPSRVAWEGYMRGLTAVGTTDFDTLDAVEEILAAGDLLGIRAAASLETRTYVADLAEKEINSPGEPGILYSMGAGFVRRPEAGSAAAEFIASLGAQSRDRNLAMIDRINPVMNPVTVDYATDVLPLTPSGNATERHICAAYDNKSRTVFQDGEELAVFWADVLGRSPVDVEKLLADPGAFRNAIRAKLMKKGGVGYAQPSGGAFPAIETFFRMVRECRAIPCHAWLDGLSAGEGDAGALLDLSMKWGALSVNIIPDRNWNIADPEAKAKKLAALDRFIKAARERDLPILVGTELNSPGQKFVDSFDAPELAPYVEEFLAASHWLYGHTVMERLLGMGVVSEWAKTAFGGDRAKSNAFYTEIGKRIAPGHAGRNCAAALTDAMSPADILAVL